MTLKKAMEIGETRINCSDGTVFEINSLADGRVMLHHFEKDGERKFNNRFAMSLADAETYVAKKLGGIAETEAPIYKSAIPEKNNSAPKKLNNVKPKPARHRFEEEEEEEEIDEKEETVTEEEAEEKKEEAKETPAEEEITEEDDWDDDVSFGETEEDAAEETADQEEDRADEVEEESETTEEADTEEADNKASDSRKEEHMQTSINDRYSMVYEDVEMTGDIKTKSSILLKGKLVGNINAGGSVGITGCVQGNIEAKETVEVLYDDETGEAEIVGNIHGQDVTIDSGCVVIGDITANSIVLKGMVNGNIDVRGKAELLAGAKVKGSVKSASMIMEEGAALDGMCVQSYAGDETPDSFFKGYKIKMTDKPLNPEEYKKKEKEKKEEADILTVPEMLEAGSTAERTEV